jgi:hypothetical protein
VEADLHVLVLEVALAGLVADGQSIGWLTSRNSSVVRWACLALSLSVWTTMPSVTCVLQAIWSLGIFSISTRHMRQLPSTGRSSW